MNKTLLILLGIITLSNVSVYLLNENSNSQNVPVIIHKNIIEKESFKNIVETKPEISFIVPDHQMDVDEVYSQLDKWHEEAPEITEVSIIGKTYKGNDIKYLRLGKKDGPKVLIVGAIHGNEKLSSMVVMGVIGNLLDNYMNDEHVTELIRKRDIFFVPIVSVEGYQQNSRTVLSLDPNRNFNGYNLIEIESIPCIQSLKNFHKKHNFKAVMSCHNSGKVYFYPWGRSKDSTNVDDNYKDICQKMGKETGYRYKQLYKNSVPPFFGYEIDWFHKHGAFAMVAEIGKSFTAKESEIAEETVNNFKAIKIFIEEAPLTREQNE